MKENKYDDKRFFEQYSKMERSIKGLAGAGEWHVLKQMLPQMQGKRVLDMGCGFGWHCRYAVEQGAEAVLGIDLSERMIEGARERNADPRIEYRVASLEEFDAPQGAFDVVISSLTLHYLEAFEPLARKVHRMLAAAGEFVFSVEHPVFTAEGSQQWWRNAEGEVMHWPVDRYFSEGRREATFLGEPVVKYHKTLTTYLNGLLAAGFDITEIREPEPSAEMLDTVEGMRDELRRPMMLLVAARKRG